MFDEIEYKKHWNDYTKKEKVFLMFHWYYYYGINDANVGETLKFYRLLEDDIDKVFGYAQEDFYNALYGPYHIIKSIRNNEEANLKIPNLIRDDTKFVRQLNTSYKKIKKL